MSKGTLHSVKMSGFLTKASLGFSVNTLTQLTCSGIRLFFCFFYMLLTSLKVNVVTVMFVSVVSTCVQKRVRCCCKYANTVTCGGAKLFFFTCY